MKSIDLTHLITPDMPVFPGAEPPVIRQESTINKDGFREKYISINSHTGTHIDAPAHMNEGGRTLDSYPAETFHGSACVYVHSNESGCKITVKQLEPLESCLKRADFLLLATGWDRYWGTKEYFGEFPVLDERAATWLRQFSLKGLGMDVASADSIRSKEFVIHKILFAENMVIIENLKNLSRLNTQFCDFFCFPLNLEKADGAPVRAIAIVD